MDAVILHTFTNIFLGQSQIQKTVMSKQELQNN